jgi:hypothetical protein
MLGTELLAGVSVAAFSFIGAVKVLGVPRAMFEYQKENFFDKFGINRMGMRVIGLAEWTGAGLLLAFLVSAWAPGIAGAGVHAVVTVGAVASHVRYGRASDAIFAILMLALALAVMATFYLSGAWPGA